VRRREFINLFCSAAACPFAAVALTPNIPRVGYVSVQTPRLGEYGLEAFRQGLRALGYVEGQTIALEVRWAEGHVERMPELLVELVGLKIDVIVVSGSQGALAAKQATAGPSPLLCSLVIQWGPAWLRTYRAPEGM
jgi:putative tryptophan/tyrosine transport system substrate-binding protein